MNRAESIKAFMDAANKSHKLVEEHLRHDMGIKDESEIQARLVLMSLMVTTIGMRFHISEPATMVTIELSKMFIESYTELTKHVEDKGEAR
jgi:hypothetical protein